MTRVETGRSAVMGPMRETKRIAELELLWCEGCPSVERALAELRSALADVGLQEAEITVREIRTDEEARTVGFVGSPTILLDGVELIGSASADDGGPDAAALTCRVYRRRDGRSSPTPDPDDLRDALRTAALGG